MASLSKKHFEALAAILKAELDVLARVPLPLLAERPAAEATVRRLTLAIADYCEESNPLFNRSRFVAAAGFPGATP